MTEVELYTVTAAQLEVVAAFMGNYATHVGIYLTLVFGYCVAAYAAGPRMSRFQVSVATVMFLVATELQTLLMSTWVSASRELMMQLEVINPVIRGSDNLRWSQPLGILIWQAGILAAVTFMWSVRRRAVAQQPVPG